MNLIAYPLLASLLATAASAKDDIVTFSNHSAEDLVESYFRDQMDKSNFATSLHLRILALRYLQMDILLVVIKTRTSFYYPTRGSS
mmetsp:Transcript_24267/g.48307  ORF Transcript_24267/g.48307 Transcript_24267/m.48307 type:complete len:86 (+) Transcript_24267:157-414(+)